VAKDTQNEEKVDVICISREWSLTLQGTCMLKSCILWLE